MRNTYKNLIKKLDKNQIFVFGSNPQGIHGAGAAKFAFDNFGAIKGVGRGLQGRSYGLITKNLKKNYYELSTNILYKKTGLKSITKKNIINNIKELYKIARKMKNYDFLIAYTTNGINLNGYTNEEMAEFFYLAKPIPKNIIFEESFIKLIFKSK